MWPPCCVVAEGICGPGVSVSLHIVVFRALKVESFLQTTQIALRSRLGAQVELASSDTAYKHLIQCWPSWPWSCIRNVVGRAIGNRVLVAGNDDYNRQTTSDPDPWSTLGRLGRCCLDLNIRCRLTFRDFPRVLCVRGGVRFRRSFFRVTGPHQVRASVACIIIWQAAYPLFPPY